MFGSTDCIGFKRKTRLRSDSFSLDSETFEIKMVSRQEKYLSESIDAAKSFPNNSYTLNQTFPNSFSTHSKLKNYFKLKNFELSSPNIFRRIANKRNKISSQTSSQITKSSNSLQFYHPSQDLVEDDAFGEQGVANDENNNSIQLANLTLNEERGSSNSIKKKNERIFSWLKNKFIGTEFKNDKSSENDNTENLRPTSPHLHVVNQQNDFMEEQEEIQNFDHFKVLSSDSSHQLEPMEKFRIIFVGFRQVGKTSIASHLFPEADKSKDIFGRLLVDGKPCQIELCHKTGWITSKGDENTNSFAKDFIKTGDAFFIVIAFENEIEISAIQFYISEIKKVKGHDFPVFFVYNKSDLWSNRDKDGGEIEKVLKVAENFDIPFINTVSLENQGKNIDRLFYHTVRYIRHNLMTGRPYPKNEIKNKSQFKLVE